MNPGASARGLVADARIFEHRARDLGIANDVSVSIRKNTIVVDLRGSRAQADLGELGQMDHLIFRPALCAASKYIPPAPKKQTSTTTVPASKAKAGAYVAPPPCGTKYKYSTSTYSATAAYNPGPGPDPALASTPSTPQLEDLPSRVVLVAANSNATGGVVRYELGPSAYDGTVPATGTIVASANAEHTTYGAGWVVNFTIKSQYSAFFDTIAKTNYHLPLAIDVGAYVVSAPTINAMSFGGSGQIGGGFTHRQASSLALLLTSGAVPLPLKVAHTQRNT